MGVDLPRAVSFLAGSGRLLDRRRLELIRGGADGPDRLLAAVDAYRNDDGGYGWGLEPDLRAPESQPAGALHAFEVFDEIGPATTPRAAELCDWLDTMTLPDGGVPFAVPVRDASACAPFWTGADPTVSTLQSTAFLAGTASRVARHDPTVAAHPWLDRASRYCLRAITALDAAPHAIALAFAVRFLDAAHDRYPEAPELLDGLARFIPDTGRVPVEGGREGESMRALNFAPAPGPARALFTPEVVDAEIDAMAAGQQDDGGWLVDFDSYSPTATLEWRGYTTVNAILVLQHAGRLDAP